MVSAEEFIRGFLLHVLPTGLVRIRHYGLIAACNAKTKLIKARELINPASSPRHSSQPEISGDDSKTAWQDLLQRLTGVDISVCPRCGARTIRKSLTILDDLSAKHETPIMNSS